MTIMGSRSDHEHIDNTLHIDLPSGNVSQENRMFHLIRKTLFPLQQMGRFDIFL